MSMPVIILNSSPATWFGPPTPAEPILILPGVGLRIGDELRNRPDRNRRIYLHHQGGTKNPGNRSDVADEIEVELFKDRRVGEVLGTGQEKRVAVGWRPHDRLGA